MGQTRATGIPRAKFPHSRILIVDHERVTSDLLAQVLQRGGYKNIAPLQDPAYAEEAVRGFDPDLIILDLVTPRGEDFETLRQLARSRPDKSTMMVVSTVDSLETKHRALALGANEFVPKPFEASDILLRVDGLIRSGRALKKAHTALAQMQGRLAEALDEAERAQIEMLARMARLIDHCDEELSQHTYRVARLAGDIAAEMGHATQFVNDIRRAARLHDLGKVVVSDTILSSAKPLTDQEIELIRAHPSVGAMILSGGTSPLMQMAERIAHSHHERWDGKGYPQNLKGEDIPIEARIVAVADAFDAMTNTRPYRLALTAEEALDEIKAGSGTQFDPSVVEAFLRLVQRLPATAVN